MTQPREDTDKVDEEVPAAHEHLRFGGLKAAVTKAKMSSLTLRQPSKLHSSLGAVVPGHLFFSRRQRGSDDRFIVQ
jgi:hypothetical protein